MKKTLLKAAPLLLCILIFAAFSSCKKGGETGEGPTPPPHTPTNYVKNISSVWYYEGHEIKKQYEITYDEAWSIVGIKYMDGEGSVISEERFDFKPSAIEVEHIGMGDNASRYTLLMPLAPDGLVQSFFYDGSSQKWNYTYDANKQLTSIIRAERGDGLDNVRWSSGNMTGSDLILSITGEDNSVSLQTEAIKCDYSELFNNYSIDINALVNPYLYPNPDGLMPRMNGIASGNLLSGYSRTDAEIGTTNLAVTYEADENGIIREMTVTDTDYAEIGEDNYKIYTFTYYPQTAGANM